MPGVGPGLAGWTRWRCIRCRSDFESKTPVCPACGGTPPLCVAELLNVHLIIKGGLTGGDKGFRLACTPDIRQFLTWVHQSTGETRAVTCPKCMDTAAFQAAQTSEQAGAAERLRGIVSQ